MLPQKFSAATTWITFDAGLDEPVGPDAAGVEPVLHPANAATSTAAKPVTDAVFVRTAELLRFGERSVSRRNGNDIQFHLGCQRSPQVCRYLCLCESVFMC
jgi:hypothetical protein